MKLKWNWTIFKNSHWSSRLPGTTSRYDGQRRTHHQRDSRQGNGGGMRNSHSAGGIGGFDQIGIFHRLGKLWWWHTFFHGGEQCRSTTGRSPTFARWMWWSDAIALFGKISDQTRLGTNEKSHDGIATRRRSHHTTSRPVQGSLENIGRWQSNHVRTLPCLFILECQYFGKIFVSRYCVRFRLLMLTWVAIPPLLGQRTQ